MNATDVNKSITELRVAVLTLTRELRAVSAAEGLTPTQTSVLSLLTHEGQLRATDIAVLEGLNPSLVSRVLTQLGAAGYLERRRNPDDGRATDITISANGREISERIRNQRNLWLTARFEHLDAAERELLLAAIPALQALAEGPHAGA
jgi:DNA-binding MarR family transcriptional regulator